MTRNEYKSLRSKYRFERSNGMDDCFQDSNVLMMGQFNPIKQKVMSTKLFYALVDYFIFKTFKG
jgi:hypothetical protein